MEPNRDTLWKTIEIPPLIVVLFPAKVEDAQTRMANRIQDWPLDELVKFVVADEIDTGIIETPMVHPVLIDEVKRTIVRGGSRLAFAIDAGMEQVPVIALGSLPPGTRESYIAADTRLTQCRGWSEEDLKAEWERLMEEEGV